VITSDAKIFNFSSVWEAAAYWPIMESIALPLAGPAVMHNGGSWVKTWVEKAKENAFRQDYIAVHWFGGPSADAFKKKMKEMYELNGGSTPLLITEFAPADWEATTVQENRFTRKQVLIFMQDVLPWLEQTDWIAGYAWFPFVETWAAG